MYSCDAAFCKDMTIAAAALQRSYGKEMSMKLGTLRSGERDGRLCLVSRDLTRVARADDIAPNLQAALDRWVEVVDALAQRYEALNAGHIADALPYDASQFLAPLPRAYQWIDAGGYMSHMQRMRAARNAPMPENWEHEPAIYQGLSHANLAPCEEIVADPAWGIDFESELAVIVDDVPINTNEKDAHGAIRLIMLLNDISLRKLIPTELAKGFGFFWGKPASTFAPVAVTPDEFGEHWQGARAVCRVRNEINGKLIGEPRAGIDQLFSFARIIEHATKTRSLSAGSIVGAGTVSNYDPAAGFSCLVEKHALEGTPVQFMQPGDRVRIEAFGADGLSIFGAIDQTVRLAPWLS